MGGQCCKWVSSDNEVLVQTSSKPQLQKMQSKLSQNESHLNSEGVPVSNAYRRYVKPPTTLGRQTLIINKLEEADEVPDWIWDIDNNLLGSKQYSKVHNGTPVLKNRHTYQELNQNFNYQKTVNLSKLGNQPCKVNNSQRVQPSYSPINKDRSITSSAKPAYFHGQKAPLGINENQRQQILNTQMKNPQPPIVLKKSFSIVSNQLTFNQGSSNDMRNNNLKYSGMVNNSQQLQQHTDRN